MRSAAYSAACHPLEDDLTIDLKKYCGLHETIGANPNAPHQPAGPPWQPYEEVLHNPDNIVVVDETYVEFALLGPCPAAAGKVREHPRYHAHSKSHNPRGTTASHGADHRHETSRSSYTSHNVN